MVSGGSLARICSGQKIVVPESLPQDAKDKLFQRLPSEWQAEVRKYGIFDEYQFRYVYSRSTQEKFLASWSESSLRYRIMRYLADTPGAEDFVLDHLADPLEQMAHTSLYLRVGADEGGLWTANARVTSVLEHNALAEPDPQVSMAVLTALHMLEAHRLKHALDGRLKNDRFADNTNREERRQLLIAEERLDRIMDGVVLQDFLSTPPPVFAAKSHGTSIRAVIIGDYGTMDEQHENQKKVADAMLAYHARKPFDFGLTVGDNFYFPMKSPHDPLWKVDFEDLYGPLGITFYPSFGNHDWDGDQAAIELLYSERSNHWNFPAPYYTYVAGPAQFFVLNTGGDDDLALDREQLDWLKVELTKSTARWKIVYGHVPIKDNANGISWNISNRLMPIMKDHADVYLSGHMHNFEHLKPEDGVNLFVAGGSGQAASPGDSFDRDALFVSKGGLNGFAVLELDEHALTMRFVDMDGRQMYETTLHK